MFWHTRCGIKISMNKPEQQPAERQPAERQPAEQQSAEQQSAAQQPAAQQPAEQSDAQVIKRLFLLALPTLGQLIAEPTFALIDTAIVGHLGDSALAGLSLGSTLILTAVGLCIFLAYSTTTQVSHLFGAGKQREGLQAGMNSLWFSLMIGVVLAGALFGGAEALCSLLGGRGDDLSQATIYAQIVALGVPGMLLAYAANGVFRGMQKVRIILIASVSGVVINTVLDILFVIVWGWGIAGSAVATCIAQWFIGLVLLVPVLRWTWRFQVSWRPNLSGIVAAGGDGLPLFLRTLALRAALVATVMAAASMGTQVLASYQIVNAAWNFTINVLDSVAIAGQMLVGTQLGAGNKEQARRLTRITARSGLIMGIVVGVFFIALGLVAGPVFSPNPEVQTLVAAGMVVMGIALPLQGWAWALDGILIGAGDFRYLAFAVSLAAAAYIGILVVVMGLVAPLLISDIERIVLLWVVFNIVFMGGRALANGLRARSDAWMQLD